MYSAAEYDELKSKYGSFSSWAIWDYYNENDTSVIDSYFKQLNLDYIFVGLNISATLGLASWINFHGGKHDRKLKYACNDTALRGSYITDLFKGLPEVKANKFHARLTEKIIKNNIAIFNQEMKDIKLNMKSQFIILGTQNSQTSQIFNKHFKQEYKNPVINHYHHSFYGMSDEEWVNRLWRKLNIQEDYSRVINKYKK